MLNIVEATKSLFNGFAIKTIYFTGSLCSQIYTYLKLLENIWLGLFRTGPLLTHKVHEPSQLSR